jgi:hypothetical protein
VRGVNLWPGNVRSLEYDRAVLLSDGVVLNPNYMLEGKCENDVKFDEAEENNS